MTLIAHDAGVEKPYIQKMIVNGKEWTSSWFPFSALDANENRVEFWMGGEQPNKTWESADKDLPPSFDTEPGYKANPAGPPALQ